MKPLNIDPSTFRYHALIGTGGIGAGTFFLLSGNHTLGREESRLGRFLAKRDYCKLHIITHYVKALLGPSFPVIEIGKVGDDDVGKRIRAEMEENGLDVRYVGVSAGDQTLFSICFLYPDGTGGNLTTEDSASFKVSVGDVAQAEPEFARFRGKGIALAAPEVPLEARHALLRLGTKYGFYRAAVFSAGEMKPALAAGMLADVDLLAGNLEEIATAIDMDASAQPAQAVAEAAVERLASMFPRLELSITAGRQGSYSWDGSHLHFEPSFPVPKVESSAGAGDSHLGLMLVGKALGLPMAEAQQLANLVAAMTVTSPHTIDYRVNRDSLREFARQSGRELHPSVRRLLAE